MLGDWLKHAEQVGAEIRESHFTHVERGRPGFNSGKVKDFVNKGQQVTARPVNSLGELDVFLGQIGVGIIRELLGENQ